MIAISKLAAAVQPSATLAAGAKAKQMKAEGLTVFDFSLGEPDFPTPEHICAAAVKAMKDGHTHYTPAAGVPELRRAIAKWYEKTYAIRYSPEQVVVSSGAKHSIHNALWSTVGTGDSRGPGRACAPCGVRQSGHAARPLRRLPVWHRAGGAADAARQRRRAGALRRRARFGVERPTARQGARDTGRTARSGDPVILAFVTPRPDRRRRSRCRSRTRHPAAASCGRSRAANI